jgi:myo-inositol 2-dehydrogenase/D-chiro-inositol 1-dehydrogenase
MTDRILRVGLVGAGRIGKVHAGNLASRICQAHLRAVADVDESAARACAEAHTIETVTTDYRQLLESKDIDAVVICSATDTHSTIIEEAARAGKHVFCEKPIDFDLARIDRALEAVVRSGVKLQIGFNRRFDANYARVRQAIVNGEIGEPHLLHIVSRDPAPPPADYIKVSGGMFLDMTIHDFDMARFLAGSEVVEVYTSAGVRVDPVFAKLGDVDTAVTLLKFENGIIGTIDNSREAVYGYDQRVEVFGSGGSVRSENEYPNVTTLSDGKGVRRDLPLNFFMDRYRQSFVTEMQAFVDAILDDHETLVTGQDGRAPVVLGIAARQSHESGLPVRVDEVV